MSHEQYVLSLLGLPRVGRKTAWKALGPGREMPSTRSALIRALAGDDSLRHLSSVDVEKSWERAERLLDRANELGIQALAATRPEFPKKLRDIPDPPLILFLKGELACIQAPLSLAVIGTREPTEFGERVARRFGQRGAEAGCVIVSGLAIGCDSAGHRGCLDAHGKTVAVLAHGLDRIYPKQSAGLAEEIVAQGGALVSEYPPDTRTQRSYFVERDRLQAGLSGGVIVVETDTDGGTMHTVRFAQQQTRPVACLVHPATVERTAKSRGNELLIREHEAAALRSKADFGTFMRVVKIQAERWSGAESTSGQTTTPPTSHG